MPNTLTPLSFWNSYRDQIRNLGSWQAYQSNIEWTEIAKRAAEGTCNELGLAHSREYLRVDVIGYIEHAAKYDWDLRVAFEVENAPNWKDELCKLTHVVADLRVIVAYECHKSWRAIDALRDYLPSLRDRIMRVPNSQWLFIFGPRWNEPTNRWTAWSLDSHCEPIALVDDRPLRGYDLGIA